MRRASSLLLLPALAACTTNPTPVDRIATRGGLTALAVGSGPTRTFIYMRPANAADTRPVVIFFDGDPTAKRIALEPHVVPTSVHPIALELALRTPARVAYITRPCSQQTSDPMCSLEDWTTGRYSAQVVDSLVEGVRHVAKTMNAPQVQLVGYSGGGTLAVLVAERLDEVGSVVTIAANLDTDAWAKLHGYAQLTRSLNPASSDASHPWPELHVMGSRDAVVPQSVTSRYFEKRADAGQWTIVDADHVCCWVEQWAELWPQIETRLQEATLKDAADRSRRP